MNGTDASAGGGGLARNRVSASAEIVAVAGAGGVTRLPVLASQVPLVLRRTPDAVYVVGGAAGPIGGDELSLRISVGPGAFLRVRTAAASIALPGPERLESVLRVSIDVGAGARLEYLPEPVVLAAGARHATIITVTLASGASLLLRDEVLLGRDGEDGGAGRSVLRVDYAGRPLLRQALEVSGTDPGCLGPAVLAGHRAVGQLLDVGPAADGAPSSSAVGAGTLVGAGTVVAGVAAGTRVAVGTPVPAGTSAPRATAVAADNPVATDTPVAGGPTGSIGHDECVAVLRLAGPGVLVTALARDAVTLRRRLTVPGLPLEPQEPH